MPRRSRRIKRISSCDDDKQDVFDSRGVKCIAKWVDNSYRIPEDTIVGGFDHYDAIYIGRAHHEGDILPAKVVPCHGGCFVSHNGNEYGKFAYEVLTTSVSENFEWAKASNGEVLDGAVQGGITVDGETLYIGRHKHNGTLAIGKVHPSHNCVYIPYEGKEHSYKRYEVLVYRPSD